MNQQPVLIEDGQAAGLVLAPGEVEPATAPSLVIAAYEAGLVVG